MNKDILQTIKDVVMIFVITKIICFVLQMNSCMLVITTAIIIYTTFKYAKASSTLNKSVEDAITSIQRTEVKTSVCTTINKTCYSIMKGDDEKCSGF